MNVEKLSDFKREFSILVATSDKYISLMNGFLVFLKENWPDNPFNI